VRPKIIIEGDQERGEEYADFALLELSKLKNLMSFQNLKQDQRWTLLDDGTRIRCQSVFGQDIITIEAAPPMVISEEMEEEKGAVFILITQTALNVRVIKNGYFPGPSYWANFAYIEASGEVLGITTDGPTPAIDKDLIISCGGGNTLYINDIEITDGIWNYENWFAQTGWPETWKSVCFASEDVHPQLTIESSSYSYSFDSVHFSYLRYTNNLPFPAYQWVLVDAIFKAGSFQTDNSPASDKEWHLFNGTEWWAKKNYTSESKRIISKYQIYTHPPQEIGDPTTLGIHDYHIYFTIGDPDVEYTENDEELEAFFEEKGYAKVERDFWVTWEGIDEHLL